MTSLPKAAEAPPVPPTHIETITPFRRPFDVPLRRRDVTAGGLAFAVAGLSAACAAPGAPSTPIPAPSRTPDAQRTSRPGPQTSPGSPGTRALDGTDDIHFGPRNVPAVALTFHGQGAPELTRAALRVCAEADAHITVFAVGTWVAQNRALVESILTAGHELGNHTWSHRQMPALTQAAADDEVARCDAVLREATGTIGKWFRPSGTPASTPVIRAAARKAGYQRCIEYDVDPLDYRDPGPALIGRRTAAQVQAGSIVSLHLGHRGTVDALPGILAGLRSRALAPVTLSVLLGASR